MTTPIYAQAIDGPVAQPNAFLMVIILSQSTEPGMYECEVVGVIRQNTRTTFAPGQKITVGVSNLTLMWCHRS